MGNDKRAKTKTRERGPAKGKPVETRIVNTTRPRQTGGGTNDYLASIANPKTGCGARIPDDCAFPSSTFQTTARVPVITNAQGRAVYCWVPSLSEDLLNVAVATDGTISMIINANGTPTGTSFTTTMTTAQVLAIRSDFVSLRPVSAIVSWTPTMPALTAQGMVIANLLPREQMPFNIGTTATPLGLQAYYVGVVAPNSMATLQSTTATITNAAMPVEVIWKPEDPACWNYRQSQMHIKGFGAVGNESTSGWHATEFNTITPLSATSFITYALPFEVEFGAQYSVLGGAPTAFGNPAVNANYGLPIPIDESDAYPYICYGFDGLPVSTTVGELTFIVNWEAIPEVNALGIVSVAPSISNPDELSQAMNICSMLPPVSIPSIPNDVGTLARKSATAAAGELYDGTPKKSAISGDTFGKRLKSWLKGVDWKGVLTTGARLLSSIL